MAVIGAIRKRSTLLLFVIGGALVLFVLSDFLGQQGGGGRRTIEPLAKVYGDEIDFREFDFEVQRHIELQKEQNPDYSPTGMELFQLRQQFFQQKIKEYIYLKLSKDLGLAIDNEYSTVPAISAAEFREMLMGNEPHPEIRRVFTNPETGQFDAAQVKNVLDNMDQMDVVQRVQWSLFVEEIKKERLVEKYKNMIAKSFYYPEALARKAYHDSRDQVNFRFVAKRYETINDTLVTVADEDFKRYYEENKKEYERDAQAVLNYVIFEARPSQKDVEMIERRFMELYEKWQESEEPEVFVMANSHDSYDSTWFKQGELPIMLDSLLFNAPKGTVHGPYVHANKYSASMVIDALERPDSLRASHILIAYRGAERAGENITRTKTEAEILADSLLGEIKANPMLFENLAGTISDDAMAKTKLGDLDWFNENMMAPEFSSAVLNNDVGEVTLTETIFGYHIIKVTGKKNLSRQVRVATLTQDIEPSKETIASEFAKASRFANSVSSIKTFEEAMEKEMVAGSEATVTQEQYAVQSIQDGREIVRWAFNKETKPATTTRMFEFPDKYQYVVTIVKSRRDKGLWELDDDLKKIIEPLVIREKKHEMIAEEMKKAGTDLYQIAAKMNLQVDTANISFNMTNLMNYGPEGRVIGSAFGMPAGKLSNPVKGVISTFTLVVDDKVKAADPENLMDSRMTEERTFNQILQQNFDKALEKAADYQDNRIIWF